jgi:hypothetical protein
MDVGVTIVCMTQVDRFSVTMPPELGNAVREAAAREGASVSTWLSEAAADKIRNELLGAALDAWEAENGPFSDEELNAAAAALTTSHWTRRRPPRRWRTTPPIGRTGASAPGRAYRSARGRRYAPAQRQSVRPGAAVVSESARVLTGVGVVSLSAETAGASAN